MTSNITFLDRDTQQRTVADKPIQVLSSSQPLGWHGVYFEHGISLEFVAEEIYVPHLYIALHVGQRLEFERRAGTSFKQHTMQLNQIWLQPPNEPFTHYVTDPCEYFGLTISIEKLLSALPEAQQAAGIRFSPKYEIDDLQLVGLLRTLYGEVQSGGPNGQLFLEAITSALALHLNRAHGETTLVTSKRVGNLDQRTLRLALEYIDANLTKNISVEQIAKAVGLSKYHFSRLFKQAMNQTPYQFVLRRRLDIAKTLLEKNSLTITQIAHQLGFADQSHFTRLFRKQFGLTPRQYSRQ